MQIAYVSLGSVPTRSGLGKAPERDNEADYCVWNGDFRRVSSLVMDGLTINVSWEYFLGALGGLIAIAYYTNGRFTALETDIGWLEEMISELAIQAENVTAKLFENGSHPSLTANGYHALQRSGLRSYVDANRPTLLATLDAAKSREPHDIEQRAFGLLAELPLDGVVGLHLNRFAFSSGMSTTILRRLAAIYLRDLAVQAG